MDTGLWMDGASEETTARLPGGFTVYMVVTTIKMSKQITYKTVESSELSYPLYLTFRHGVVLSVVMLTVTRVNLLGKG